jgi:hypothetical protein
MTLLELGEVNCCGEHQDICVTVDKLGPFDGTTVYCRNCMQPHGVAIGGRVVSFEVDA